MSSSIPRAGRGGNGGQQKTANGSWSHREPLWTPGVASPSRSSSASSALLDLAKYYRSVWKVN